MDATAERLAERIRSLAAARGMPISHVADRAGVGRAFLFAVLEGRSSPTVKWLTKVAAALECEPWELLAPPRSV